MNFKSIKMFFTSLLVFCACCIFGQDNSFAFYPKGYEWEEIIKSDTQVEKAIDDSKDYINITSPHKKERTICSNVQTLTNAISKKYPEISYRRCKSIAKFKLLESYIYTFFDYSLYGFRHLIETSDNEEKIIQDINCEISTNWNTFTCNDFIKYLVCDICKL